MHAQLVDVGRDVATANLGGEGGLLEGEKGGGEGADVVFGFELAAGLEPLPGAGNLDADAGRIESRVDVFEERDDAAGAGDGCRRVVGVEGVGLDVHEAGEVRVDLEGEQDHLGRANVSLGAADVH